MQEIYLVDCENVGTPTIIGQGIYKIYYFCNPNQDVTINGNPLYYDVVWASHNHCKDALDFIIHFYLWKLIAHYGTSCTYYIVSNDRGFDNVINLCKDEGYDIKRITRNHNTLKVQHKNTNKLFAEMTPKVKTKINNICIHYKASKKFRPAIFLRELTCCLTKYSYTKKQINVIAEELIKQYDFK